MGRCYVVSPPSQWPGLAVAIRCLVFDSRYKGVRSDVVLKAYNTLTSAVMEKHLDTEIDSKPVYSHQDDSRPDDLLKGDGHLERVNNVSM